MPQALCHELFDLGIAIDLIGDASAFRLGINQTDLICLDLLARQGLMGPSEIAAAMGLTTAAISAMAARLEAGGYARREMDPSDRRRVVLHASPAGAQRAFSLFDDLYRAVTELQAAFDPKTVQLSVDLIARFRQLIADQAATLGSPAAQRAQRRRTPTG